MSKNIKFVVVVVVVCLLGSMLNACSGSEGNAKSQACQQDVSQCFEKVDTAKVVDGIRALSTQAAPVVEGAVSTFADAAEKVGDPIEPIRNAERCVLGSPDCK